MCLTRLLFIFIIKIIKNEFLHLFLLLMANQARLIYLLKACETLNPALNRLPSDFRGNNESVIDMKIFCAAYVFTIQIRLIDLTVHIK